jgi:hypothetical protein
MCELAIKRVTVRALTPPRRMQLVPVLPVVTKADTMTVKESIQYRRELNQKLQNPAAPVSVFLFSTETLDTCGVSNDSLVELAASRPPYLVVCSNTNNEERMQGEEPEMWPERRYIWGTSEAMNPQHSDLLLLRRLLLQEGVEEIAESKIARCALLAACVFCSGLIAPCAVPACGQPPCGRVESLSSHSFCSGLRWTLRCSLVFRAVLLLRSACAHRHALAQARTAPSHSYLSVMTALTAVTRLVQVRGVATGPHDRAAAV